MEVKELNIYERLSNISIELSNVAKNLEVGVGKSSYKAVGEADILKAVKPLEAKYRVYSYPIHRQIIESGTLESEGYNGATKKQLFERIEVIYRFVNMDKPEEYIDIISYGDGIDTSDKGVGKAMTYADKYALMKAYKIITGDDPDQNASEPLKSFTANDFIEPSTLAKAKEVGVNLEKLAVFLNKEYKELTNKDVINAIVEKQKRNKEKAQWMN